MLSFFTLTGVAQMEEKVAIGRTAFINALAFNLSRTWLEERPRISSVIQRMLGRSPAWSEELSAMVHEEFVSTGYANQLELRQFLGRMSILRNVFRNGRKLRIRSKALERVAAYRWPVPQAKDQSQLQDLLCLTSSAALDWLVKPHVVRSTRVDHYRRHAISKKDGQI